MLNFGGNMNKNTILCIIIGHDYIHYKKGKYFNKSCKRCGKTLKT